MGRQALMRRRPTLVETVEGKAIHIGGRELIPVVRLVTYTRRQALVGTGQLSGRGWGFVRMRPIAILERSEAGERRIPIRDKTAQMFSGLILAAFIIPLLLAVAVRLARKP